jgi:hypothetical protein
VVDDSLTLSKMTEKRASEFADIVIRKANSLGRRIAIWQSANEVLTGFGGSADDMARVASFDQVFSKKLKAEGFQTLGTAMSTGTPHTGDDGRSTRVWNHYWPALDMCWLNIHEYWHTDYANDGEYWHVGRTLNLWDKWPAAHKTAPVMISELGFEVRGKGWRGSVAPDKYLDRLASYSARMPETWAASLFCVGNSAWQTYDVQPLLPRLAERWKDSKAHVWPLQSVPLRGYDEGYRDGYNKAIESGIEALKALRMDSINSPRT